MVNVTKDNFLEQSNDFLKHLPTAAFIAIDEEMTGISLPTTSSSSSNGNGFSRRGAAPKDETPGQRYVTELKQIPERYSIIQFGISLFHSTATDPVVSSSAVAAAATTTTGNGGAQNNNNNNIEWKVRRYNFYMFPNEKSNRGDVIMNPGAVHFLNQHNMSFDEWTKKGINFCTTNEAHDILQQYVKTTRLAQEQVATEDSNIHPPSNQLADAYRPRVVELRRTEDIDFFSRTMASLREWLDSALPPPPTMQQQQMNHPGAPPQQQQQQLEGTSLLLPECNAFMRRALYESIQQEYPSLVLENAASSSSVVSSPTGQQQQGNRNQIRVWRLNDQEKLQRRLRLQRQAWENVIVHKIGMTRIFTALARVCSGLPLDRHSVLFAPSVDHVNCWDEQQVATVSFVPSSPTQHHHGRKVPIVVHNGFMDLCFLITHFCQHELPETLMECKALIRNHFPIVYDTKILSTETYAASLSFDSTNTFLLGGGGAITNTRLDGLFDRYGRHGGVQNSVQVVSSSSATSLHNNGRRNPAAPAVDDDQEHEAAYDAYMTGVCFIGLIHDIQQGIQLPLPGLADYHEEDGGSDDDNNNYHDEKDYGSDDNNHHGDYDDDDEEEGELDVSTIESDTQKLVRVILSHDETAKTNKHDVRALFGRNKLFQISMYTMDLEEPIRDPLSRGMQGESAFRISGFDPNISTRDIVRCLAGLVDGRGRRVNFEIIWIDDTTFIVAACWRPTPPSVASAANARAAASVAAAADAGSESEDSMIILQEHGQLVYDTLTTCFSKDMIVNLNDYLDSLEAAATAAANAESGKDASAASSWTSRIWGMFGFNKKRAAAAEDNEIRQDTARSNKRRRVR